jgi:polyhydroxyalkanoate synthesis regulator phasin
MTENIRLVLDMLAAGKITTEEADRLIDALRGQSGSAANSEGPEPQSKKPRFLRVMVDMVDAKEGPIKVNVRVPIMLLRAGVRLASLIPVRAQERVNEALREQGVDIDITKIKPENLNELIDELRDLSVDVGNAREDLKIKVFTE